MICITSEIIEQQQGIKETTESLLDKNKLLQMKSGELNQVLEKSQKQLQTMATIPIELINELANAVKQMKDDQQERLEQLLKLLENVHKKADKQKCLATGKSSPRTEPSKVTGHADHGSVAWVKPQKSLSRSNSVATHLTILDSGDTNGSKSPNSDDPASQSEAITENEPPTNQSTEKERIRKETMVAISTTQTIKAHGKNLRETFHRIKEFLGLRT